MLIKHRKSKKTKNPRVDPLPTTAQKNPNSVCHRTLTHTEHVGGSNIRGAGRGQNRELRVVYLVIYCLIRQ